MVNDQGSQAPIQPGYGPLPGTTTTAALPIMSRSRAHVLSALTAQSEPCALAALIDSTGLHANTVREHLRGLENDGLVRRERATPVGRGRPAWLYSSVSDHSRGAEYAGLATALAATLHRTSTDPRTDAIVSGAEWGRALAAEHGSPADRGAVRRQVIDLLDAIGFAPRSDADHTVVHLTRCPLLAAAHRYPDVVCAVHLGIVRGALEEYDVQAVGAELFPFSNPGACRLELTTGDTNEDR